MNPEQTHELNAKLDDLQRAVDQIIQERYHTAGQNVPEGILPQSILPHRSAADAGCPEPANTGSVPQRESETSAEMTRLLGTIQACTEEAQELRKRLEPVLSPSMPCEKNPNKEEQPRSAMACAILHTRLQATKTRDIIDDILARLQV